RPGAPAPAHHERARRGAAARRRRSRRAHRRAPRRPADRHAHRTRGRAVLPVAARAHTPPVGGEGMSRLIATAVTVTVDHDREILSAASIAVRAGEVHALVGPNGAGKSTLFGVLAGDLTPAGGTVTLDGTPL